MHVNEPALDVDIGPLEMDQLVEAHARPDRERRHLADPLRALDQQLRNLLARLDPFVQAIR
jgi:hypothetical protein